LVFCAHGLGVLMRLKTISDRDLWLAVLLAILPVAVILAVGLIRVKYIETLNQQTGGGLAALSPLMGVIIFVTMNLVIYLGAFVLSYLHHDPEGEMLERLNKDFARASRSVRRQEKKIERLSMAERWLATKVELWHGAREQAHRTATYEALRHKDFFEAFMQAYWSSNRVYSEKHLQQIVNRARRRGTKLSIEETTWKPPISMTHPPEINLPTELRGDFVDEFGDRMVRTPDTLDRMPRKGLPGDVSLLDDLRSAPSADD
jgi:hypothetical protein